MGVREEMQPLLGATQGCPLGVAKPAASPSQAGVLGVSKVETNSNAADLCDLWFQLCNKLRHLWSVPGLQLLMAGTQGVSGLPCLHGVGGLEAAEMPFLGIEFG